MGRLGLAAAALSLCLLVPSLSLAVCGDGVTEGAEECDDGTSTAPPADACVGCVAVTPGPATHTPTNTPATPTNTPTTTNTPTSTPTPTATLDPVTNHDKDWTASGDNRWVADGILPRRVVVEGLVVTVEDHRRIGIKYTLPCQMSLHVDGRLTCTDGDGIEWFLNLVKIGTTDPTRYAPRLVGVTGAPPPNPLVITSEVEAINTGICDVTSNGRIVCGDDAEVSPADVFEQLAIPTPIARLWWQPLSAFAQPVTPPGQATPPAHPTPRRIGWRKFGGAPPGKARAELRMNTAGITNRLVIDPTISTTWADVAYNRRLRADIDGGDANGCADTGADCIPGSDLTTFPIYVPMKCGTNLECDQIRSDCFDVVFYDTDQSTKIAHELEGACTTTATEVNHFWVAKTTDTGTCAGGTRTGEPCADDADCPSSTCSGITGSDGDHLWAYYENPSAADTSGDPWDASFKLVLHLAETSGGAGAIKDSSGNAHHFTDTNSPTLGATGRVGNAIDFEASTSEYLLGVDHGDFSPSGGPITMSMWIKWESFTATTTPVLDKAKEAAGEFEWEWYQSTANGKMNVYLCEQTGCTIYIGRSTDDSVLSTATWTLIAARWDGGTTAAAVDLLKNGVEHDTTDIAAGTFTGLVNSANKVTAAARGDASGFVDGVIDEIRFSSADRSNDWLKAEYDSQRHDCGGSDPVDNSCFLSFGAVEVGPTAGAAGAAVVFLN